MELDMPTNTFGTSFIVDNDLQLHALSFQLVGKVVYNKCTHGFMDVDLHAIDYSMDQRQSTKLFKSHHHLSQVFPLWPST